MSRHMIVGSLYYDLDGWSIDLLLYNTVGLDVCQELIFSSSISPIVLWFRMAGKRKDC